MGDDRGGGARAVRVRGRLPRGSGLGLRRRAVARARASPAATTGAPVRFVVMAMGKLGGEELNFSSDVDICYFYDTDAGAAGRKADGEPRTLHEYYEELARRVTAALDEATGDGIVFRVDLRLRPEGRSGPLSNSLHAAEGYYETFGRTWERQAWLRARPCAGRQGARRRAARHPRAVHLSAQHRFQAGRGRARPAGPVPRSCRRAQRAGRDRLRREAGGRGDPRRRDGRPGVAAPERRQAPGSARAQHAACAPPAGGGRAALRSRGLDAADRVPVLAAPRAPGPGGDGGAAAQAPRRRRGPGRAGRGAGLHRPRRLRRRGVGASRRGGGDRRDAGRSARGAAARGAAPARSDARPGRAGAVGRGGGVPRHRRSRRHPREARGAHAGRAARGDAGLARSGPVPDPLSQSGLARLGGAAGAPARRAAPGRNAGDAVRDQRSAGRPAGSAPRLLGVVPGRNRGSGALRRRPRRAPRSHAGGGPGRR